MIGLELWREIFIEGEPVHSASPTLPPGAE
jgi:hypothetical protein